MQQTSDLYRKILANPHHRKEVMLDIAGIAYAASAVQSVNVSGALYSSPGIGNCVSRQGVFVIYPDETKPTIPRQASIKPYVRLVADGEASEWLQKGEFFISTRQRDKLLGTITIHAFDAMLKAEDIWWDNSMGTANWPMSQRDAVISIASKIGVAVDERTWSRLSTAFPVEFPFGDQGEYTMREVLSKIAISCAGNWVISDTGGLLLVPYGGIPAETNYLITNQGDVILFGEVRLLV